MTRTMHFEVGYASDDDEEPWFWLQVRWSDGQLVPIGEPSRSADQVLNLLFEKAGEDLNAPLVRMPSIPTSGTSYVN